MFWLIDLLVSSICDRSEPRCQIDSNVALKKLKHIYRTQFSLLPSHSGIDNGRDQE